ncbi:DgyrCDS9601 [Dimorphilus gyrociliatus]|uniref:DgyrCDS9601 n=1 Tax=Dimorphilus gyrociliatus TaxID=2664684 RepID=A0A7I8VXH5_9ANNE|nr:DgyrCDS9601 [Dimorphilus gyrociliatus]
MRLAVECVVYAALICANFAQWCGDEFVTPFLQRNKRLTDIKIRNCLDHTSVVQLEDGRILQLLAFQEISTRILPGTRLLCNGSIKVEADYEIPPVDAFGQFYIIPKSWHQITITSLQAETNVSLDADIEWRLKKGDKRVLTSTNSTGIRTIRASKRVLVVVTLLTKRPSRQFYANGRLFAVDGLLQITTAGKTLVNVTNSLRIQQTFEIDGTNEINVTSGLLSADGPVQIMKYSCKSEQTVVASLDSLPNTVQLLQLKEDTFVKIILFGCPHLKNASIFSNCTVRTYDEYKVDSLDCFFPAGNHSIDCRTIFELPERCPSEFVETILEKNRKLPSGAQLKRLSADAQSRASDSSGGTTNGNGNGLSSSVLAIIISLVTSIVFVIVCILGFTVSEVVCKSDGGLRTKILPFINN